MNEVVAMLEDEDATVYADVFITQTADGELSAEDNDNHDQPDINHLPVAQLSAETRTLE